MVRGEWAQVVLVYKFEVEGLGRSEGRIASK